MKLTSKKAATSVLLSLLFSFSYGSIQIDSIKSSIDEVIGDSLILKCPEEGKIAYIQEGANLKIWTRNGNVKGTMQKFKNDSLIVETRNGFLSVQVNVIKKIRVYDSRAGIVLLGKAFNFGGNVSYVLAGVTLGVAGLIAIATGDFFPFLFVPPLVGIGIIAQEIGGSIQGKKYKLHKKWIVQ